VASVDVAAYPSPQVGLTATDELDAATAISNPGFWSKNGSVRRTQRGLPVATSSAVIF
jgi:hypothetical protein